MQYKVIINHYRHRKEAPQPPSLFQETSASNLHAEEKIMSRKGKDELISLASSQKDHEERGDSGARAGA